jgi:hypothetical protein
VVSVFADVEQWGCYRLTPKRTVCRAALGEHPVRWVDRVVDEDKRLGIQQRVRAKPALALPLFYSLSYCAETTSQRQPHSQSASLNAIGAVQRLLRGPEGLATEHGQPVEALESLLIEPILGPPPPLTPSSEDGASASRT